MLKIRKIFIYLILTIFKLISSSLKFNIPSYRDKCFQQEIYIEGTLLIRYDLTGFEEYYKDQHEQKELFDSIKIFVKSERGFNVYENNLRNRKDKLAVHLRDPGIYQVCARYTVQRKYRELPSSILLGLKIRNDYQYTDIDNSLHKEDVYNFWKKIGNIKRDMTQSIEAAKAELKEEDKTAKSMIHSINTYYKLCICQLVIIIVITMHLIFSYKDFFKQKSII